MIRALLCLATALTFASPAHADLPIPPSGPISGTLECLFDSDVEPYAAAFTFRENAPARERDPLLGDRDAFQVYFQQFPLEADRVERVTFQAGGVIVIQDRNSGTVGTFTPVGFALRGGSWMRFSTPSEDGTNKNHGHCFGDVMGRVERPIALTRLYFIRID